MKSPRVVRRQRVRGGIVREWIVGGLAIVCQKFSAESERTFSADSRTLFFREPVRLGLRQTGGLSAYALNLIARGL